MNRLLTPIIFSLFLLFTPLSGEVIPLYPEEGDLVSPEELSVVFSYNKEEMKSKKLDKVILIFENQDVTDLAEITDYSVSFIPDNRFLKAPDLYGEKSVTLIFYGEDITIDVSKVNDVIQKLRKSPRGVFYATIRFRIIKAKKAETPVETPIVERDSTLFIHKGNLYTSHSVHSRPDSSSYIGELGGSGSGFRKHFFYNYNFYLTTEEDKRFQTLQRFYLNTGYTDHLQLSVGDLTPRMHPFILNGDRSRGGGIHLSTPSYKSNLDFVVGYMKQSITPYIESQTLLNQAEYFADSLYNQGVRDTPFSHNDSLLYYVPGTFLRRVIAARLHFGDGRILKTGTTVAQIRDDNESIEQLYSTAIAENDTATVQAFSIYGTTPKDNLLIGQDLSLHLFERKVQLFGNASLCMITDATSWGTPPSDSMINTSDSLTEILDDWEWASPFIIINNTTTPKPSGRGVVNSSAFDGGVRVIFPLNGGRKKIEIKYQQIGSNYKSLAYERLPQNRRGLYFTDELRTMSNRLYTRVRLDLYEDNLDEIKPEPTRSLASHGVINLILDRTLPRFSLNGGYIKHRNQSHDSTGHDKDDANFSIGGKVSYSRPFTALSHTWSSNYLYNHFRSNSSSMLDTSEITSHNLNLSMITSFPFNRLNTRVAYTQNVTLHEAETKLYVPSIGAKYYIIPRILYIDSDLRYLLSHTSDDLFHSIEYQFSSHFLLKDRHSFNLNLNDVHFATEKRNHFSFRFTYQFRY